MNTPALCWKVLLLAIALNGVLSRPVRGQTISEFPVTSGRGPEGITKGSDGNLWFAEHSVSGIGRITPDGTYTEFGISHTAERIVTGPDGALWFTEGVSTIGRLTTSGDLMEFAIPTADCIPFGIASGPDGNVWFTENAAAANKIGRITTTGTITEFPVPTAGGRPGGIIAGPDGNLWFTELAGKIGRITVQGTFTEYPIPTLGSFPDGIAVGSDLNLWFSGSAEIGRITTNGAVTEYPVPNGPYGITSGPDGNLWFVEFGVGNIGRFTTTGGLSEFAVPTPNSGPDAIVAGPDDALWFTERNADKIGRATTGPPAPVLLQVDSRSVAGSTSNSNGVLEPGETVQVAPIWRDTRTISEPLSGNAENLGGPAGATYLIQDGTADYGLLPPGQTGDCNLATADCYLMSISGARPGLHWDAVFTEVLAPEPITHTWTLHIGESFADTPVSHPFYSFVETALHNGVSGGCGGGNYCPGSSVTRAQMAVFLLKGKFGPSYLPPPATGTVFNDVHIGDFAADWIEALASLQITGGCGNGAYCPTDPVTRSQMAVFLLKAEHGSAFVPPTCTGVFTDVICPSTFAGWIEQLFHENVTGGCGGGLYCPTQPNTRGQMAVFLVKTFSLELYGP